MSKNSHIVMPEDHMEELYTSKNPLVRFVHTGRLKAIVNSLPVKKGSRVLDAGCGEGQLLEKIHEAYPDTICYGADVTPIALEKARARVPHATLVLNDLAKLDFPDNFFDAIACTEVIEHIYEYENVLKELKRVLKPGGTLIITFPNETLWTISRFLLGRRPIKVPDHVNAFTPKAIKKAVALIPTNQKNLPFGLPFFLSLNCLIAFTK